MKKIYKTTTIVTAAKPSTNFYRPNKLTIKHFYSRYRFDDASATSRFGLLLTYSSTPFFSRSLSLFFSAGGCSYDSTSAYPIER